MVFTGLLLNPEQRGPSNCGLFSRVKITGGTREKGNNTTTMLWLYLHTLQSPALYIISTSSIITYQPVKYKECALLFQYYRREHQLREVRRLDIITQQIIYRMSIKFPKSKPLDSALLFHRLGVHLDNWSAQLPAQYEETQFTYKGEQLIYSPLLGAESPIAPSLQAPWCDRTYLARSPGY